MTSGRGLHTRDFLRNGNASLLILLFVGLFGCGPEAFKSSNLSDSEANTDGTPEELEEDIEALPPQIMTGAYLSCTVIETDTIGCSLVGDTDGSKVDLSRVRASWVFRNASGGKVEGVIIEDNGGFILQFPAGTLSQGVFIGLEVSGKDGEAQFEIEVTPHSTTTEPATAIRGESSKGLISKETVPTTDDSGAVEGGTDETSAIADNQVKVDGTQPSVDDQTITDTNIVEKHLAFITSEAHTPGTSGSSGFGDGLVSADATCQKLAEGQSLRGTWKAFLGDSATGVRDRVQINYPVYNLAGQMVSTPDNFWLQNHNALINYNELREKVFDAGSTTKVWTGSSALGAILSVPSMTTCRDWTSSSDDDKAVIGLADNPLKMLNDGDQSCEAPARLICISQ